VDLSPGALRGTTADDINLLAHWPRHCWHWDNEYFS
jgi:hypothetical protein